METEAQNKGKERSFYSVELKKQFLETMETKALVLDALVSNEILTPTHPSSLPY